MPTYGYLCEKCGNFRDMTSISERNKTTCPKCGRVCERDVEYELNIGDTQVVTDNPRWSVSMGVPAHQVEEFRKRFPDSVYDSHGRLLIKNRNDKLRQMKERDFVEIS